jgi:uncharacterized protein
MRIASLHLHPIKGAAGIPVSRWRAGPLGLELDRRWMLVGLDGGFLSQRRLPRMALLRAHLGEGAGREPAASFRVEAPGTGAIHLPHLPDGGEPLEVEIWGDRVEAIAPDSDADRWFSDALETRCRAVFLPDEAVRPVHSDYASGHRVGFADGFPLLLATTASLTELNRRLPAPLPMDRFRPNVVVEGAPAPHAEDGWRRIRAGSVEIHLVKPCARCIVTTVDPARGVLAGPEPLRTLATYRRWEGNVFFGQNGVVARKGTLHVGDLVTVEEIGPLRPPG